MISIKVAAEELFTIFNFSVTNAFLTTVIAGVILCIVFIAVSRKVSMKPRGAYNALEGALEGLLRFMDGVSGSRAVTTRFFPVVGTMFFFILFANWLSVVPGFGSLVVYRGGEAVPLLRTPASDYNFPLALAIVMFILFYGYSIKTVGIVGHMRKYIYLNPLKLILGVLDLVGDLAKVISLSFRLFGNILSGEALMLIVIFFMQWVLPTPVLLMGLFFGTIQALVFSTLTLVFLKIATEVAEVAE